jgi:transcriptional regulator with XRE-family HTH domain
MPDRIAENLRRLAGMHLLSQDTLAAEIGITRVSLSKILTARSRPSLATAERAAALFGITVDQLLSEPKDCLSAAVDAMDSAPIKRAKARRRPPPRRQDHAK